MAIKWTEIPKPDGPYMTLEQCIRANGDRHMVNAARYAADGLKEHAFGSYRKARRNYTRADGLRSPLGILGFLAAAFEDRTLHG